MRDSRSSAKKLGRGSNVVTIETPALEGGEERRTQRLTSISNSGQDPSEKKSINSFVVITVF